MFSNDNLSSKSINCSISWTHLLTISLVGTTNYGGSNLGGFMFLFLNHFQRDYYCGYWMFEREWRDVCLCVFDHACLMVHLLIGTYFSFRLGSNEGSQWRGIFLLLSFIMHIASSWVASGVAHMLVLLKMSLYQCLAISD